MCGPSGGDDMISLPAVIALCFTVIFETAEQLCWTMKSRVVQHGWMWIGIGLVAHFAHLAAWFFLLKLLPLSVALPLTGIDYVVVALLSSWLFSERLDWRRWVGTWLIVCGMILVGAGGWSE